MNARLLTMTLDLRDREVVWRVESTNEWVSRYGTQYHSRGVMPRYHNGELQDDNIEEFSDVVSCIEALASSLSRWTKVAAPTYPLFAEDLPTAQGLITR